MSGARITIAPEVLDALERLEARGFAPVTAPGQDPAAALLDLLTPEDRAVLLPLAARLIGAPPDVRAFAASIVDCAVRVIDRTT